MLPPAPGAPRPPGTHTAATLQPLRTRKEKSRRRKTPDPNALLSSPGSSRHQFLPPDPSCCCCCRDRKAGTAKLGRRQELTVLPPAEGSPAPGAVRELTGGSGHVRGLQEWEKLPGNGTEPSRGWESPGGTALEGRDGRENNSRSSGGFWEQLHQETPPSGTSKGTAFP